jgi:hypothetical protein
VEDLLYLYIWHWLEETHGSMTSDSEDEQIREKQEINKRTKKKEDCHDSDSTHLDKDAVTAEVD